MMNYRAIVESEFQQRKAGSLKEGINLFVPVDFSESSYTALSYAMRLASMCHGSISLLHVIDTNSLSPSESPLTIRHELTSIELKAKKKLNSLCEIIAENGVQAGSTLQIGNRGDLLHEQIKKLSPDVLVVGKNSAMHRLISSSSFLSKQAHLVVPPTIQPTLPHKVLMIRDDQPVHETLLKPLSIILNSDSNQLTVVDIQPGLIRRLLFKYLIPLNGVEIEINRKFHNVKSTGDDLDGLITKHKPDMVCRISRPPSLFNRAIKFVFNSNGQEDYHVPTLVIPTV